MDYFGTDRKLSELGEQDLDDFLDQDMFTPPASDNGMDHFGLDNMENAPMDSEWLDNFFDDPVLNDRMMTDALQPRRVQSEHSYSLTNGERICIDGQLKVEITEKDVEADLLVNVINPNMSFNPETTTAPCINMMTHAPMETIQTITATDIKHEPYCHEISMATSTIATTPATVAVTRTSTHPQTLLKQPTIFLATQQSPQCPTNLATITQQKPQERLVLPKVNIKMEPIDTACSLSSPEHTTMYDSIGLPPTPPSSSNSDSEGSLSPQRSAPPSPIRHSQLLRQNAHIQHTLGGASAALSQPLFTSPIPTSGVLILSEEEKRTLIAEGYPIPNKLPLTKQEEKNLKKIRRKIKNKISAQESRRKKKEYLETLEKKVESYNSENSDLKKKVELLENNNRSLLGQLQKLQSLVSKVPRPSTPSTQTGTCLMVLVLFFAVFVGTWSPMSWSIGYSSIHSSTAAGPALNPSPLSMPVGQPIGPEIQDTMTDPYSTPNARSRVLLSIKDDQEEPFGPQTPSYKDFFTRWFTNVPSCPEDEADQKEFTVTAPLPNVDGNNLLNQTHGSTAKYSDMSVNYTAQVLTTAQLDTVA